MTAQKHRKPLHTQDQWRDGTMEAPVDQKAPKPPREPETGAYREG